MPTKTSNAVKPKKTQAPTKRKAKKAVDVVDKDLAEAVPKAEGSKRPRVKRNYACITVPNLTYDILTDTDEGRKEMNATIMAKLGEHGTVVSGGRCSGSSPSLAANKKTKIALENGGNIIILREVGQFRTFFPYATQRIRVKELEYTLNEQGVKVSAIDKATGQDVAPIVRRVKGTAGSADLVTSLYWSEFENKVISLGRMKFTKKPAALSTHSDDGEAKPKASKKEKESASEESE